MIEMDPRAKKQTLDHFKKICADLKATIKKYNAAAKKQDASATTKYATRIAHLQKDLKLTVNKFEGADKSKLKSKIRKEWIQHYSPVHG